MADEFLDFYGTECVHCHEMDPIVEKVEKELGVKFKKIEVWHNAANAKMMEDEYDKGRCGGVPFYFNKKTGKFICGAVDYETFKKFAAGK